jgi:hypothetical protein
MPISASAPLVVRRLEQRAAQKRPPEIGTPLETERSGQKNPLRVFFGIARSNRAWKCSSPLFPCRVQGRTSRQSLEADFKFPSSRGSLLPPSLVGKGGRGG